MDTKASARAKHASSQRGRARHSTRKRQPQVLQQQKVTSDPPQPEEKKDLELPSNWSRYEEEEEEEEEGSHFDAPPVKSKGANYKDLLAEKYMLQGPDLASGRKALMVTRGLDLWSQFTNMDSLWSIGGVSGEEDNFFTLDLDFLNKELSKLDMAQRLLLDAEYACLREIEKSERVHKVSEAETVYEEKTILTLPSRTSSLNLQASLTPQDIDGLNRSTSPGNEEPGGSSVFAASLLEMPGATAKHTGDHPKSFSNKESEIPDGNLYSVSKEPSAQLAKTANLFDAESAEAELDALLDMLDTKTAGQAPTLMPVESFGLSKDPVLAFQQACHEAQQESSSLDLRVDSSNAAPFNLYVGTPNDSLNHMTESTNSAVKATTVFFKAPDVDTRKSGPSLDEDFDNWLDSL